MKRLADFRFRISDFNSSRRGGRGGFTLVELLVVITIIALLAAVVLGALAKTQEVARLDATKATVAKLNNLVMPRYESYMTRRIPINVPPISASFTRTQYSTLRLHVIRDLMRMEMPDRLCDISTPPQVPGLQVPSLQHYYQGKLTTLGTPKDHIQAKCLYMWVMGSIPEAKTMFGGSEVADVDHDGWKVFIDGWGKPIGFLRWAPGATTWSDVQIDDTSGNNFHHDPFDPNFVEKNAYHLYPLIFAGVLGKTNGVDDYGIALGNGVITGDCNVTKPSLDPYGAPYIGPPAALGAFLPNGSVPLVHNQHMEHK